MTNTAPSPDALMQLIFEARKRGRFAEALDHLQMLPTDMRDDFQVLAHEADLLGRLGDHDSELALLDRLIADWPEMASLWVTKANALKTVGRTDEAIAASRKAIAIQPAYGKAWWVLSELKTYEFSDADVAAMEAALHATADQSDLLHLRFGLGKAYEDRRDPAAAFEHYAQGNALRATSIPPAAISVTARVDRAIATFTPEAFSAHRGGGFESDAPIFVVGLQRSGSTLIEQILSSHPQIEGTAELGIIPQLHADIAHDPAIAGGDLMEKIASLDAAQSRKLGEAYVERAKAFRSTDRPKFIDKLPTNWLNIGFIRLILPKARIIDARRHPMATGFSNFKQNYGSGVGFAYSQQSIGRYYRDYLRLMAHFERVQPGAIHRVVNEELVADFEAEVRRLLDFVGVPFDPACLEFHRTDRPVRSASAEQVRRPISRAGVDQWRAFEPWLGEMKAALGPALDGWNAPPGTYQDEGN